MQAGCLQQGEEAWRDKPHGGRHPAPRTVEEEQELLAPFLRKAAQGEVVVAAPVPQAYEEKLGPPVHHSVIDPANRRFESMDQLEKQLVTGLAALESDAPRTVSLTGFDWITCVPLNAN